MGHPFLVAYGAIAALGVAAAVYVAAVYSAVFVFPVIVGVFMVADAVRALRKGQE